MPKRKSASKLTVKTVDKLLRAGHKGKHLDRGTNESQRGLYLVVAGKRAAHWELRYQRDNGPTRYMGLGSAFAFDLGEARERARRERQKLADGVDPLTIRRAERAAAKAADAKRLTFREAAERFYATHESQWTSDQHKALFLSSLERWAYPFIGATDVAQISTDQILKILEQPVDGSTFWNLRTVTADRTRNRIRQVLDWAKARKLRDGDNAADWEMLKHSLPAPRKVAPIKNQPSMPYSAVPGLMDALASHEGVGVKALQFTILTAARVGEVMGARWAEVDLAAATWTIPAERMKARRVHRVPLAPEAIALLRSLPTEDGNPFVFVGRFQGAGISAMAQRRVLWRLGHKMSVHGFRSSFREWAAERTRFPRELAEMSLAHKARGEVEAAYQRGDLLEQRRPLMGAWAKYVTSPPVTVSNSADVVAIGSPR